MVPPALQVRLGQQVKEALQDRREHKDQWGHRDQLDLLDRRDLQELVGDRVEAHHQDGSQVYL
jgi:hypothetical protein